MVTMIFNLMALEEGLQNLHHYLDHLDGKLPVFKNDPTIITLMDRLHHLEKNLHEALTHWPQMGLDFH